MRYTIVLPRFSIIALLWANQMVAQITITQSEVAAFFSPGGRLRFHSASDSMVNVGQTGGANIYDFTTLSFTTHSPDDTIYQVSQIPQLAIRYPTTAMTSAQDPQNFGPAPVFLITSDSLTSYAENAVVRVDSQVYDHKTPPERVLSLPLTYGMSWSSSITKVDTTYIGGVPVRTSIQSYVITRVVDGFGTLRLPQGDFQCLRIREFHQTGDHKEFSFWTREGAFLAVRSRADQPDTGSVLARGITYFLGGALVSVQAGQQIPTSFSLQQNYPNPFNPTTTIRFAVPKSSHIILKVYNLLGQEIQTLVNEKLVVGEYEIEWNANGLPSGVYLYRLQAGDFVGTRKLILLR